MRLRSQVSCQKFDFFDSSWDPCSLCPLAGSCPSQHHQRLRLLEASKTNLSRTCFTWLLKTPQTDSLNTQPYPIPHSANFTSFLFHFYPLPCLIAGAWLLFMESQFLASPHSSPNPSGSTPLVPRESSGQQDDVSSREFRCTADLCGDLLSGWTRRLHNA